MVEFADRVGVMYAGRLVETAAPRDPAPHGRVTRTPQGLVKPLPDRCGGHRRARRDPRPAARPGAAPGRLSLPPPLSARVPRTLPPVAAADARCGRCYGRRRAAGHLCHATWSKGGDLAAAVQSTLEEDLRSGAAVAGPAMCGRSTTSASTLQRGERAPSSASRAAARPPSPGSSRGSWATAGEIVLEGRGRPRAPAAASWRTARRCR